MAPVRKRLICLANSRKLGGRCIAGKEIGPSWPGPWVRPVSRRPYREVSEEECKYEDGDVPQPLDVLEVGLVRPDPVSCQRENWLLDPTFGWTRTGTVAWSDLKKLADRPLALWRNDSNSGRGLRDRVSCEDAERLTCSLYLIHASRLHLEFWPPANSGGNKRSLRGRFRYRGLEYSLAITDLAIEKDCIDVPAGCYPIDDAYLTISLGEPLEGFCYKLIAAVLWRSSTSGV